MAVISLQTPYPSLVSIEGEIVSIEGMTAVVRYKKPRRQFFSLKTVSPFAMVVGEVGGIGSVYYFSSGTNFDLEGDVTGVEDGVATIDGPKPALINLNLVALHADVEKDVEEAKPKKKKKSSAVEEEDEAPVRKKKKKKKKS